MISMDFFSAPAPKERERKSPDYCTCHICFVFCVFIFSVGKYSENLVIYALDARRLAEIWRFNYQPDLLLSVWSSTFLFSLENSNEI